MPKENFLFHYGKPTYQRNIIISNRNEKTLNNVQHLFLLKTNLPKCRINIDIF